ncbi:Fic family protein [Amycolatopsis sp. NPDC005232]|uniref:type II toxin-antitoxin system death-on-curing family toxin n=1 Tax=Amycolatopsis sp. NPDC005232 TaxID=3157027 RepID=UPI0033B1BBA0
MTEYLTIHDLMVVARRVVRGELAVRDTGILAAAAARPRTSVFGEEAYPGVWEKAAALMESLGRGHPLIDGNKRLAWTATWFFLGLNDKPLRTPLDEDAAEPFVHDVVQGHLDLPRIAARLADFA